MKSLFRKLVLFTMAWLLLPAADGQGLRLKGVVKDSHNEEPIPYASVVWYPEKRGTVTDSLGVFTVDAVGRVDSIVITYVGYSAKTLLPPDWAQGNTMQVALERKVSEGVVVRTKANWGLILWRKVVRNKPRNNRSRFSSFAYEVHNKLELDLNRVNAEKLRDIKLLKPFSFILNNIDSSEGGAPVLPIFMTETISDYYRQRNPVRSREVIRASKTNGINNESVTQLLGGMYQNVNVYDNFIPVFDKQFVSPLSSNGDAYYNYTIADTVEDKGRRYYHWLFSPRRKGDNTFVGDAWIHDGTFAVQRIQLRIDGTSTVNHIENLSIYQDFQQINDSLWFLSKDKFIADVYPIGKNRSGMKGRKTTTYRHIQVNAPFIADSLALNKIAEEVIVVPGSEEKADTFWTSSRHEALNKNEQAIYLMMDTLQQMPMFKKYSNTLSFLATGYKPLGKFEIGPWFNWVSLNGWEGMRMRFDLGTTPALNPNLYLHGYLAYGFGDQRFKGKFEAHYYFNKNPRKRLSGVFFDDLDNGQNYYGEVTLDNIFTLAVRKPDIPIKFLRVQSQEIEYYTSNAKGWSVKLEARRKIFTPLRNLPPKELYENEVGEPMNTFETAATLRFAYLEKFLTGNYFRTSLGSIYPVPELRLAKGWAGVLGSSYDYYKLSMRVNGYHKLPPLGSVEYSVYGGKIFGTLPYTLLDIAPGNEIYYYNKYAFNLMNRFEYVTDAYAGVSFEHNVGSGLFKYIPITRRLKLRQFYNVKTLWGSLTDANRSLNFVQGHPFQDLSGTMYTEIGTGIDNIVKFLRLDLIWRLSPRPLPPQRVYRFGVFFSFRLAF